MTATPAETDRHSLKGASPPDSGSPAAPWHCVEQAELRRVVATDPGRGLSDAEARRRLVAYGPNEIARERPPGLATIIARQFADLMVLILLIAAAASALIGELGDTITIGVIVVLNAVIGATQEFRAQRAIDALRRMSALETIVSRAGRVQRVAARELVPGDVVLLEAGNVVAADIRLIEVTGLRTDESTLTGESMPIEKRIDVIEDAATAVADRANMAFRGTSISAGRGRGIVVATGGNTEIGRIAGLMAAGRDSQTPLQRRLAVFGRRLALAVIAVCVAIFVIGILNGEPPQLMILVALSLAVAAIPEALPAVVTVSLALGARMLSRHRSLIRRLSAVESLGSITCICSDKTGTLTENRMRVAKIHAAGITVESFDALPAALTQLLGPALAVSNDLAADGQGDATESALAEAAERAGYSRTELKKVLPQIAVLPFDSERKLMTTVHERDGRTVAYTKGAPEQVLAACTHVTGSDGLPADELDRYGLLAIAEQLASDGYRVLAVASRDWTIGSPSPALEQGLSFVALVSMHDPIRPEVPAAIAECRSAGIRPVMVTGDHPATARQIGRQIGLLAADGKVLNGRDIAEMDDDELARVVRRVSVYARVDPAQKIRIVEAMLATGEYVAMTGDGVNDAPALKRATIGVAMGQRGTDVARETADLVLLDDNFATIVTAVREGRRIYDNIRKFIRYTMTSNTGEIAVLLVALLLVLPLPLLPIHILWINLVTDGMPGLAFSAEPAEANIMQRAPRPPTEGIFARGLWQHMLTVGTLLAGLALGPALWIDVMDAGRWQTMVFTILVFAQLFQAMALRSESLSVHALGWFSNPAMLTTVGITLIVQALVVYLPFFNAALHTVPLSATDFAICLGLGSVVLPFVECQKWLARRRAERRRPNRQLPA